MLRKRAVTQGAVEHPRLRVGTARQPGRGEYAATVRALRTARPQNRLQIREGRWLFVEVFFGEDRHNHNPFDSFDESSIGSQNGFVKYIIPTRFAL